MIRSQWKFIFLLVRYLDKFFHVGLEGKKAFRWNPSDPLVTKRFVLMAYRIYPTLTDCDGTSHVYLGETWKKFSILDEGLESLSDGIHRIHRTRTYSDGKVYVLFVGYLGKFDRCWLSL